MSAEPIQVELSKYGKLQILRQEYEDRTEELEHLEATIREKMLLIEQQKYLESISPYYGSRPLDGLPTPEELQELEQDRQQLFGLISAIESLIPTMLEGGTPPPPPPPAAGNTPRKAKFDSFTAFVKKGNTGDF